MSLHVYWRIPMGGDASSWRNPPRNRGDFTPVDEAHIAPGLRHGELDGTSYLDYTIEVARAAEAAGFYGGLLPSFPATDDPWIVAAGAARATTTFHFMVAFQPGFLNPVHAARMSASFQKAFGSRLVYNIITGGGGPAQLWWGDTTPHDDRYARTTEFLDVLKGVWNGGPFDYDGRFYKVNGGGLPLALAGQERPDLYFSGSSEAAVHSAGAHADYYLSWLEHPGQLRTKFEQVREVTAAIGRTARFAVRIPIVARPTEEEAWDEVRAGWARADHERIQHRFFGAGAGDSVGLRRQASYDGAARRGPEDLVIASNVFAGIAYLGDMPNIGLVGSYEQVAERLDDLVAIGVDAFILSGLPHLEEAFRIGEEVLPLFHGRSRAQIVPTLASSTV